MTDLAVKQVSQMSTIVTVHFSASCTRRYPLSIWLASMQRPAVQLLVIPITSRARTPATAW